jgi:hypothetical protein
MAYARYDFSATLERVSIEPATVDRVIRSWGDSPEGYGSWEGSFALRMKDGRFILVSGWCDTSGWGCQDGAHVFEFDSEPTLAQIKERWPDRNSARWDDSVYLPTDDEEWDESPGDLNLWLQREGKSDDVWD